ncbi:hypothetical protein ACJMK2_043892, partial [Sinanodonta woodiana]
YISENIPSFREAAYLKALKYANQDILQDVQTLLEEIQIPFLINKDETVVCSTDSSIREYQDKKTPLLCRHPPPYSGRDDDIVTYH